MITLPSVRESFENLLNYMVDGYLQKQERMKGVIQLCLTHESEKLDYYFDVNEQAVTFKAGRADNPTATLTCKYSQWLDLAAGRMNPVLGTITRKLVFTGDLPFFKRFMADIIPTADISRYNDPPTPFEKNPLKHWFKPERVLVLNGSPRGQKGSTYFFLKYFMEGFIKEGVTVDYVTLKEKNIEECRGCMQCFMDSDGQCIIRDEMEDVMQKRDVSDMIVFAFPLYIDGMPSLIKKILDRGSGRSFPVYIEGLKRTRRVRKKKKEGSLVLFSTCGYPEISCFDALRKHFKAISHNYHRPLVAEILRPAALALINNPLHYSILCSTLSALESAASEMVRTGRISGKTMKQISQPAETPEAFRKRVNMYWQRRMKEYNEAKV